jgi:hypothetical protein
LPHELPTELLRRTQAKDRLVDYILYCEPGFVPAKHHRRLIRELEAVERGECPG